MFGDEDEGGDAVCWLGALCPECGAMPSGESGRCWRCGAELAARRRAAGEARRERGTSDRAPEERDGA